MREALLAVLGSKKYGGIEPAAVERIFLEEVGRHKSLKEASKRTKARLHQLSFAFMSPELLRLAHGHLERYLLGDEGALFEALKLHASTSERLFALDALWDTIAQSAGGIGKILDLACGLNPLYLGHRGHSAIGLDISLGQVALVNEWATRCGWDIEAHGADLSQGMTLPTCDVALMMKLLPVLEQQRKGAGMALLSRVQARRKLVTFPTRTLGGRTVGMEAQYTRWFEENLPPTEQILDRFVVANELCYVTMGRGDDARIVSDSGDAPAAHGTEAECNG